MAYLETNRGCPMRCAFCCYNLNRRGWSSLPPAETERRIRVLRRRGAREIRLVDPTFNAHRRFRATLAAMRRANADKKVRFFVEIRADTLTAADAAALADANVTEAEVGVQSTDAAVLRRIHRPARLDLVRRGIELLVEHGIKPTIDFMYGLPGQCEDDIDALAGVAGSLPQSAPAIPAHPAFARDRIARPPPRTRPARPASAAVPGASHRSPQLAPPGRHRGRRGETHRGVRLADAMFCGPPPA